MRQAFIYGLTNSFGLVFYVRKTVDIKRRYRTHCKKMPDGSKPSGVAILDSYECAREASLAERRWIAFFGRENLLNRTPGGCSWADEPSAEHKKNISDGIRRANKNPAVLLRRSLAQKARFINNSDDYILTCERLRRNANDPEWMAKVSAAINEAYKRPSYRQHVSDAVRKSWDGDIERRQAMATSRLFSPEVNARRGESLSKTLRSESGRASRSAVMKRVCNLPEQKLKRSQIAHEAWKNNNERKSKLSSIMKRAWVRRKAEAPSLACIMCTVTYKQIQSYQKYCSDECRNLAKQVKCFRQRWERQT